MTQKLSLSQAQDIIASAIAERKAQQFPPMGFAVLDDAGDLIAYAREDGASMFRFDIARAKAWGAVGMGVSSRTLGERAKDNPNFFVSLSATSNGRFLPQTGAVLVKDKDGQILGAIGASGGTGDKDEAVCVVGVTAVGLSSS